MNEKWECFLCGMESLNDTLVSGYIGNYHPVCKSCTDSCLASDNIYSKRLTYHYKLGEIKFINSIPYSNNYFNQN